MKKLYLLIMCVGLFTDLLAQDWMGLHSSNYAGVQGISFQPASIVDSRYKFQMNLIGVSATFGNNYYAVPSSDFKKLDFEFDRFIRNDKDTDRGGYLATDVYAPFSFMLTMSPKHAMAITLRQRNVFNFDGIGSQTADFIDEISEEEEFVIDPSQTFDISNMYVQGHSWAEIGLTYGRVIFDQDTKFLKAGGTLKILDGIASGYAFMSDVRFSGLTDDRVNVDNIDVETGFSDNLSYDEDFDYKPFQNLGLGLDLGAVYEYRPNIEQYKYEMDGEDSLVRRDKNKYKFRVGFSILDLGGIKYKKSDDSGNLNGSVQDLDINQLEGDVDEIFEDLFNFQRGGSYKMALPTRLLGEFDLNVAGGFFLNFTSQLALRGGNADKEKSRYVSTISLTPRLEGKTFGLALPVSYNKFSNVNSGVSLRIANLVIGSSDVISNFALGKDAKSLDVHVALRFGLPYHKKKDKDNDGVSNKKDLCRKVPGVWEFKGCPDRDSDGVQDSEDACPDEAGLVLLQGCPDQDGDGIKDSEDTCPEVAGLIDFKGCPDVDGDGIQDSEDACPDVAGTIEHNGCPDKDGDGVIDSEDLCPDLAGTAAKQGCPDSDGDGIYDNEDKCPELSGPAENLGCPYTDTDGDGIIDRDDECVLIPGVPENNGCPEIKEEEQEILNTAFTNLEFESGKAKIAMSSYTSLVELANLLKLKPDWKLHIVGHTDNVGQRATNLKLSKERAQAVADFLTAQGVEGERFIVEGLGPDHPVADNSTKEGKKQNRRVELEVIFK